MQYQEKTVMKQWKQVVLSVIMILCAGAAYGGDFLPTKVYMFGFAASFNDSTVYFTDVQQLEGAWVYEKERSFLVNRDEYSYQLRNFLKQMGLEAPTCVTVYAFDEKEIYKKYLKLRQRYEGKKRKFDLLVRNVPAEVFAYKVVEPGVGRVIMTRNWRRQRPRRRTVPRPRRSARRRRRHARRRRRHRRNKDTGAIWKQTGTDTTSALPTTAWGSSFVKDRPTTWH